MGKILAGVFAFVTVLTVAFFAFNSYIYREKQGAIPQIPTPYPASLSGTYRCGPIPGKDKLLDSRCQPILETDTGETYALDFGSESPLRTDLRDGDRIAAKGTLTPIEYLSTDYWDRFGVEGILSVSGEVEKK
jgi:hypothetical protein